MTKIQLVESIRKKYEMSYSNGLSKYAFGFTTVIDNLPEFCIVEWETKYIDSKYKVHKFNSLKECIDFIKENAKINEIYLA
jgi:hypothetical protein